MTVSNMVISAVLVGVLVLMTIRMRRARRISPRAPARAASDYTDEEEPERRGPW